MANSFSNVNVGKYVKKPTHDVKLTDVAGRELGLILCDGRGKLDPTNLKLSTMPRTAMQTSQGMAGYSDLEMPYVTEIQKTWVGGRGQEDFTDDRTKYFDAYRMDTTREYAVCGPKGRVQRGIGVEHLNVNIQSPVDGYYEVDSNSDYLCFRIRIENAGTISSISTRVQNDDTDVSFDYIVLAVDADEVLDAPDTYTLETYNMEQDENEEAYAILPVNLAVLAGQDLCLIIGNFSDPMEVWYSITGADFIAGEKGDVILTTEDDEMLAVDISDDRPDMIEVYSGSWTIKNEFGSIFGSLIYGSNVYMKLFEYKHQVYAVVNDTNETAAPRLYMNGYRGVAKSNAGNLFITKTDDLNVATNELAGQIIFIWNGPGEMEVQPWRVIESNTASPNVDIRVTEPWNVQQTDETIFVILGSDDWFEITGHGLTRSVTDIEVTKGWVVFAMGKDAPIKIMRSIRDNGTKKWTTSFYSHKKNNGPNKDADIFADFLEVGVLEDGEVVLWRARADECLVDYSLIRDWAVDGADAKVFYFDVNKRKRDELRIDRARLQVDYNTENAKPSKEKDKGYLESLNRLMIDLTQQITYTANAAFGSGGSYAGTFDTDQRFLRYDIECGNTTSKITGLSMYGQPPIPYVLKEDSIGSINNNIYAEIPIPEMTWLKSEQNGKANMQQGVYLYFNLAGGMIERYYDMRMDDVGPGMGEGLPRARQGEISCLLPYPGRFYASMNAGLVGYSSVLCNNGLGWHEIYRSGTIGKMITDMYVQIMPGFTNVDRMFISEGTGVVAIPIIINPQKQYDYEFYGYGLREEILPYIETSWIDFGLKDVNKFFHKVAIFSDSTDTELLKGTEYNIFVYYKIDNQKNWKLAGKGGAYSSQEIVLSDKQDLYGKRLKLRVAMQSNTQQTETPKLKAIVTKAVLRVPIKRSWQATFLLEPMKDLQDMNLEDEPGAVYDRLYEWSNSDDHATPLLMNANDGISDNKMVFIDPASISTHQAIAQMEPGSGVKEYKHIGQIVLYEA